MVSDWAEVSDMLGGTFVALICECEVRVSDHQLRDEKMHLLFHLDRIKRSAVWNSIVLSHNYLPNTCTVFTHYSAMIIRWNVHQVPTFARYILEVRTTRNRLQAALDLKRQT